MKIRFKKVDHVQICIPKGEEEKGREFYCGILGLNEIDKPNSLKKKWRILVRNSGNTTAYWN
tara:strand:+ start:61 stop:246 length:186 start_codon:yes stop_codon:yes gene_type:complete